MTDYTFANACEYLNISSKKFIALRDQGLVVSRRQKPKQSYDRSVLDFSRQLLDLGHKLQWGYPTLAWYADLVFSTEVGRAILLPIAVEKKPITVLPGSWLETPYIDTVAQDLQASLTDTEGALVSLLRSMTATALGQDQFWPDRASLRHSALYPIIQHFESAQIPILDQGLSMARDIGPLFGMMLLAFITIAPPISHELSDLVHFTYARLRLTADPGISPDDRALIIRESQIAVDKLYASKATEIHTPPETWNFEAGVLSAQKRTITVRMHVPSPPSRASDKIIDNIIDIIRPYVGTFGARLVHLLYETANDEPYWRNPLITVNTNDLLDRLGVKRDKLGYHYSESRERLRDALNAAHNLEIIGEYYTRENNRRVRKVLRRTVLSLIGATFDAEENSKLSTLELLQQGLPRSLQIRLNFYDGVRRVDGQLGNQYVLMPRLGNPYDLRSARHASTEELLKAYILMRCRQTESRTFVVTRALMLEKANIKTKHVTRATQILTRALDRLVADGTLQQYSPVPVKPHQSLTLTVAD